ncbi:hypothetical protein OPV22_016044 [Ensete ventricosum]|uniref:Uncharacterized protein n=1 Tax=Ensete ventricosum TaxID=4639 RepID=A0AAV8QUI0_ENSVE|nr:hypothetical protein OPV22_016044 [Ensete ventricosum]
MYIHMDTSDEMAIKIECDCCGVHEDCTPTYICSIKASFRGKWICGLCCQVVNEQMNRTPSATIEEAMESHMSVCNEFNSTMRLNPKLALARSLRDIARKKKKSTKHRAAKDSSESKIGRTTSLRSSSN